ncbi:hypothetical protein BJ085DRAFT_29107 [Dimargaris cristalligena]|uniref:F-box domain-containing protein n=1 Tax=Dimargaris cristalligena TaxID=215637 RepID=A0A4P9ZU59_9FUNG|nr:hypothetical protein BJ085DRAFT_29107 [Dimargaris cristalligena]|eukprot:RKP37084.1 hypothetical protein BJ085DRAFT_29107 [Dimargaris cristalligena]
MKWPILFIALVTTQLTVVRGASILLPPISKLPARPAITIDRIAGELRQQIQCFLSLKDLLELRKACKGRHVIVDSVLIDKVFTHWDDAMSLSRYIFTNQVYWESFAPIWFAVAPLETWDSWFIDIDTGLGWAYAHCATADCQHGGGSQTRGYWNQATAFDRFLGANPVLKDHQRVYISLGQLGHGDLRAEFPFVSKCTGSILKDLLVILGHSMKLTTLSSVLPTDPSHYLDFDPIKAHFDLAKSMAGAITTLLTSSLWHLHRTDQVEQISLYFQEAIGVVKTSLNINPIAYMYQCKTLHNLAYLVMTLAAIKGDQKDFIDSIMATMAILDTETQPDPDMVFKTTRVNYLRTLTLNQLHTPLAYFRSIWPELKNKPLDRYEPLDFIDMQRQWLTNQGDLHQAVPLAMLHDPTRVLAIAKVDFPPGHGQADYSFANQFKL